MYLSLLVSLPVLCLVTGPCLLQAGGTHLTGLPLLRRHTGDVKVRCSHGKQRGRSGRLQICWSGYMGQELRRELRLLLGFFLFFIFEAAEGESLVTPM